MYINVKAGLHLRLLSLTHTHAQTLRPNIRLCRLLSLTGLIINTSGLLFSARRLTYGYIELELDY